MVFKKLFGAYQNNSNGLFSTDLTQLIELREIYNNRIDRIIYNDKIFELIEVIVKSPTYDGEDTKMIYKNILFVSFVQEENIDNYTEITKLLNVTAMVAKQYADNPNLNSFDSTYITQDFLLQMCLKLIKQDDIY
ncbi:hypothetical protein [Mucilaginibacter flavus]|uniref:hypothetical protein n=1 Tax=Mucilaginibacter flavus TaxID=931504 RepID=UPI0025B619D3|nr:hypothetical protein [Mucilaginibacter flavus]MDN3584388.1 hypothetical protein [Mucilaginibacter flavus]